MAADRRGIETVGGKEVKVQTRIYASLETGVHRLEGEDKRQEVQGQKSN